MRMLGGFRLYKAKPSKESLRTPLARNAWNLYLNQRSRRQIWEKIETHESYTWMNFLADKSEEK